MEEKNKENNPQNKKTKTREQTLDEHKERLLGMKEKRSSSFLVLGGIYLAATLIGVAIYFIFFPLAFWLRLLLADIGATIFMFAGSLFFNNASVYDPYWSVQPIVIVSLFAMPHRPSATQVLLLIAIWFWGMRLTANWAYTFHGLTHEDWRYVNLRKKSGSLYPIVNFFGIHLVPTLIVYSCVLPAVYAIRLEARCNFGVVFFFLVALAAVIWQGIADLQMQMYRSKRTKSGFIHYGLWKHSRHPNYLGEIVMWWAIGMMVFCTMPHRWYLLIGAALNTILFFTVSIPMAERRQAQKPGFEQYKSVTRLILPFPRMSQIQSSDPPRQTEAKPAETKAPETTSPAEEIPETKMPEETIPEGKVPEESFPEAFDSETDPREQ